MSDWEALGLIALAGLLGAILGFEREIKEKAAGIRTHLLVAAAAGLGLDALRAATLGGAAALVDIAVEQPGHRVVGTAGHAALPKQKRVTTSPPPGF